MCWKIFYTPTGIQRDDVDRKKYIWSYDILVEFELEFVHNEMLHLKHSVNIMNKHKLKKDQQRKWTGKIKWRRMCKKLPFECAV